jgi:putative oxidoreductase
MNLSRFEPFAHAALRVVSGLLFSVHGMQKTFGWFGGSVQHFGTQLWLAGAIELVCGLLIAAGLFTRAAAFLASGEMAVAYFQGHFKLQVADWHWLPAINKGELAVLYCFVFLWLAASGPGPAALDKRFSRR